MSDARVVAARMRRASTSTDPVMRILVIEDDAAAADYLVKAFGESGHLADHAGDGEEGLHMAREGDYDVLIVDRMLPKRDGLIADRDACAREGRHTPVLILSALGQVDDRVRACGPAATTTCPSPTPSPSCSPASRRWRRRRTPAARRRPCSRSATSSSTGWPAASPAPAPRSSCSRASSACSNT